MMKTKPFDAAKYLESAEDFADLVNDALATGHPGYISAALGTVARAYGMSKLAQETGLNRATLYAALKEGGNPTLDTVVKVTSAFGVTLGATPQNKVLAEA
ncbi:addiction module antidote protein [Qipengyuania sp. NPDC077563]|uniref:addiction module antidote protein n=1 Tax=Qipengyuania sp. NPDC077563 TaxID=3364497 RepID=UPI00384BA4E5